MWQKVPASTVANAAPLPHANTKIKIGSRMIFVTAPMRVFSYLILAKPCAVNEGIQTQRQLQKSLPQA